MSDYIETCDRAGVFEIRINRPGKKNALTADMYNAMSAGLIEAEKRPEIRVVLFSGAGEAYCAGNDLNDFASGPESGLAAFQFIRGLASFEKPMIAAVQGLAVGVGATMLFHADLVYATPDARFVMPFVNLGLVPEAGSSLLAPRVFGHAKAAAMLLLGEPFDAVVGERAGFLTAILPAADLLDQARAKAIAISEMPPAAMASTRALLKGDRNTILARIDAEAELFSQAMTSFEAQEALAAFFDKRKPVFRPR